MDSETKPSKIPKLALPEILLDKVKSTYHLEGVEVHFPEVQAFTTQIEIMKGILKNLSEKKHTIIESPTGTGKTMAMICAVLAYQHKLINEGVAHPPRIYFASRTHSQLKNTVDELKRCPYQALSVVLGGKKRYCLNEQVNTLENVGEACFKLIKPPPPPKRPKEGHIPKLPPSCQYFQGSLKTEDADPSRSFRGYTGKQDIVDIEDLMKIGAKKTSCSYYSSIALSKLANVVVIPYNYLFSRLTDFSFSIVIIDEAHNLPSAACEAGSMQMTEDMFINLSHSLKDQFCPHQKNVVDYLKKVSSFIRERASDAETDMILTPTRKEEDEDKPKSSEETLLFMSFRDQMKNLEVFSALNVHSVINSLELLVKSAEEPGETDSGSLFPMLKSIKRFLYFMYMMKSFITQTDYLVTVIKESESVKNKVNVSLGLQLMNPERKLYNVLSHSCAIMASGTLHPVDSFSMEFGGRFLSRLGPIIENDHVVDVKKQLWISTVSTNSFGSVIKGSFNKEFKQNSGRSPQYYKDVCNTIIEVCSVVPGGVLVFVSSYSLINHLKKSLNLMWSSRFGSNSLFFESDFVDFDDGIRRYKESALQGTAALIGVFRGKLSEGINLSNDYCRGCILVGIPYMGIQSPFVVCKRMYQDRVAINNEGSQNGDEWYDSNAFLAVNQALGRVLRHSKDYGAVVLLDSRYSSKAKSLCKWSGKEIAHLTSIDYAIPSMQSFFQSHNKKEPISTPTKKRRTSAFKQCQVCLKNPRTCLFIPCYHLLCCSTCANQLHSDKTSCPECEKEIESIHVVDL